MEKKLYRHIRNLQSPLLFVSGKADNLSHPKMLSQLLINSSILNSSKNS